MGLQGVLITNSCALIKLKGPASVPQKMAPKMTFLSLAFYHATSLHTVDPTAGEGSER